MAERSEVPASVPRFEGIDVLRGLSIIAVVVHHTWIRFRFGHVRLGNSLSPWWQHLLFFNGQNAVTVFFAVSGFLITMTSLRRFGDLAAMRPGTFYRIRFARIAPLLLSLLTVLSLLHLFHVKDFVVKPVSLPHALFSALTFHLNWLEARYGWLPANWDVLWSLSIEEAFYVGFPLACFAMLRRRFGMSAFIALLLAFVAVGPWARAVWAHTEIWQEKTYLGGMDAIALGCLTALVVSRLQERRSPVLNRARSLIALQLLGCAMMALVMAWPTWPWYKRAGHLLDQSTLYATILPLGVCFVMAATVLRGSRGALWTAPVRWFGRHSYEIYMTHEFVAIYGAYLMLRVHRGAPGTWAVAILLCTAPLGWAVARWLSEPANRALRGAAPPPRTVPSYA